MTEDFRLPKCESSGLYYPSTTEMELLALYDDGLRATSSPSEQCIIIEDMDEGGNKGERVFCRICRDNLHDIDYDIGVVEGDNKGSNADNNGTVSAVAQSQQEQGEEQWNDVFSSDE